MRFLAFSDIHGYVGAIGRLVSEVRGEPFDFIVFAGDFTNAWADEAEEGRNQMERIAGLLSSLGRPFYYVRGNRDYSPMDQVRMECPIGESIEKKDQAVGEYVLTSRLADLDRSKILVHHALHPSLAVKQADALLYLYGHDHRARIYSNYVDLGFLYRHGGEHGAMESLYGCYWFVDVEGGEARVTNHSWELRESICPRHRNRGIFYVPYYWKKGCPLCYDEREDRFKF